MANPTINLVGSDYQVTGSTRVHGYLTLDLSGGDVPGGGGVFTVMFPFASAATPAVALQHGSDPPVPVTLPAPTTQSTTVGNYRLEWSSSDAGPVRTVLIAIFNTGLTPPSADSWVVKIAPIPPGPMTTLREDTHVISAMTKVEADPFIDEPVSVPATAFAGQMVTLSGMARRNTLPLPTATDYNPPTPQLTWAQTGTGPSAPVPPGTTVISNATLSLPAAAGYSAVATFPLPAGASAATLQYAFTATFGEFTASSSGSMQVTALADYWMLLVDRSGTMAQGTPVKRTNAVVTAQVWADVISAFHYSSTSPDKIGVIDFSDASPGGFRATGPAGVDVSWPAPSAMGSLRAITDPAQDGFKVAGTSVLGPPQDQTPLGDALIKALDVMAATSSGNASSRYHVLVVTDAIENTGTVKVDAASPIDNASQAQTFDLIKSSPPRNIFDYTSTGNIRIYPVATGFSNTANVTVVNSLGTYGLGPFWMSNTTRDLFPNAFGTALFAALGAHQPSVSSSPPFNMPSTDPDLGANPDKFVYFGIPNGDAKLVVVVLWSNPVNTNELDLGWRTASMPVAFQSLIGSAALTVANRDTHAVAVVDLSQLPITATETTEWRVSYRNAPAPGGMYQPMAPADVLAGRDLHVSSTITFDRAAYYSDEPIVITASVHAGPKPISGAKVLVEVEGPALSEGELLASNSRLAVPPRGRMAEDSEGPHPASREAFLGRICVGRNLSAVPTVQYSSVFIDGTNELRPDRDAGDGYYVNVFAKNWREGTYNFRFTISGKTPEGGSFSDVHAESRLVTLRAEDAFSKISVAEGLDGPTPGLRSARIRVTPRDALGQRLGPFRAGDVHFQTTRGVFLDEVESEFDGSYSQILVYPEKQVPVVTVQVQGRSFTPVVLSGGLSGAVTSIVRAVLAWLVRSARHR